MNGYFVPLRMTLRIAALWFTLSFLASCIAFITPASAPEGVQATKGSEEDRVIITWSPVKHAGVYLLYRSSSKDGEYEYLASTDGTSYVDVKVIPLARYWYIVAAADLLGRPESEKPSLPVEGWCFHTFSWESSTVALNASGFDLASNPSVTGEAFLAWAGPEESPVNVAIYGESGWENLTDSFGVTNGSIAGSISIAVSADVPYVAYRDEASLGKLTAVYFDGNGEETAWTLLGSAGQSAGPVRELQSAFAGLDLYVAALDDTVPEEPSQTQLVVFRFSAATGWEDVSPEPPVTSASSFSLTGGPEPFIAYTDQNGAVTVLRYDDGRIDTDFGRPSGGEDVPKGYLDLSFDETTSTLAMAFYDVTAEALKVSVFDYGTDAWSDMSVPVVADPQAGTVGVSADQGMLYLFYKDLDSRRGTVVRLQDSAWETLRQDDEIAGITGQYNLKELAIEARQQIVFAIAQEGNSIQTDVYR